MKHFLLPASTAAVLLLAHVSQAFQSSSGANLPYVAVHDPRFVSAAEATFMHPGDRLIGITNGTGAKAYPAGILSQHGLVEDRLSSGPIAVTWWSYCNTALVFRAEIKGRQLVFDNAGLVGGNEVFKDRETGTRWQQSSLEAISGPLQGEHLQLFPFLLTNWAEWRRLHPGTLVLKPLPGYADRIATKNEQIRQGLSGEGEAPSDVPRRDNRLRSGTMILGLDLEGANRAYPLAVLRQSRVINDTLGGRPIVIVHQPGSDTTTAFRAQLNGKALTFTAANTEATELTDTQTHSHWTAYGHCSSGALKGSDLEPLILEPEYWFAWFEFHPDTTIYSAR